MYDHSSAPSPTTTAPAAAPYVELGDRAQAARVALIVVTICYALVIAADVLALPVLSGDGTDTFDPIELFDVITGLAALPALIAFIAAAVFFIRWLNAAHRNLDALSPGVRRHATWWSIGGWFIPIMGLFRPLQILNDLLTGAGFGKQKPWWASTWWALFLTGAVFSSVGSSLIADADTVAQVRTGAILDAVVSAVLVAAGLVALIVVRETTAALEDARRALPAPEPIAPPDSVAPPAWP